MSADFYSNFCVLFLPRESVDFSCLTWGSNWPSWVIDNFWCLEDVMILGISRGSQLTIGTEGGNLSKCSFFGGGKSLVPTYQKTTYIPRLHFFWSGVASNRAKRPIFGRKWPIMLIFVRGLNKNYHHHRVLVSCKDLLSPSKSRWDGGNGSGVLSTWCWNDFLVLAETAPFYISIFWLE